MVMIMCETYTIGMVIKQQNKTQYDMVKMRFIFYLFTKFNKSKLRHDFRKRNCTTAYTVLGMSWIVIL